MIQVGIACAPYLRDIARGKEHPRDLTRDAARTLWGAVLSGAITDLELGAVLVAMRIKGEAPEEIAGFLDACNDENLRLALPPSGLVPVIIPSYNGARKLPNLTPLLAILLARAGLPVLVHGKVTDSDAAPGAVHAGRTTTAEILCALGFPAARHADDIARQLARGEPAFVPIQILNPALARVLALRRVLGVRNSAHSLVKMLQPFAGPALRLASYTHPEYHAMLSAYYRDHAPATAGDVLLARGTEGEAVANARRAAAIEWFHQGTVTTVAEAETGSVTELPSLPDSHDAVATARWIQAVLAGERPVPEAIARQVEIIVRVVGRMR